MRTSGRDWQTDALTAGGAFMCAQHAPASMYMTCLHQVDIQGTEVGMHVCTPVLQEKQAGITRDLPKGPDWPEGMSISLSLISATLVSLDVSAVADVLIPALSGSGQQRLSKN